VKPDKVSDEQVGMPAYTVSYKRQELVSKYPSTVRDLLDEKIPGSWTQAQFKSDVMKPLKIEELLDRQVANLSGGELQRVKLCVCLGKVGLHTFPTAVLSIRYYCWKRSHIINNTLRHCKQIMCFGTKIVLMKLHIPTLGPAFCNLT
jgi:translation initiation factor RLI1